MMFLGSGYDLISLYIALELMAVTFYVLVAFTKRQKPSNEAAMKYFLLGAFSSGILLYGMSLLYGVTRSTNLRGIRTNLGAALTPLRSHSPPNPTPIPQPKFLLLPNAPRP